MNSPHHFLVGENSSNRIHIYIVICLTHMFIFSYKIITYRIIYIYMIFLISGFCMKQTNFTEL